MNTDKFQKLNEIALLKKQVMDLQDKLRFKNITIGEMHDQLLAVKKDSAAKNEIIASIQSRLIALEIKDIRRDLESEPSLLGPK